MKFDENLRRLLEGMWARREDARKKFAHFFSGKEFVIGSKLSHTMFNKRRPATQAAAPNVSSGASGHSLTIEQFLGLEGDNGFTEQRLVDPENSSVTLLVLHSLVERAVKTAFTAMMTNQVEFLDDQQRAFFEVVSQRLADEQRQYSEALGVLRAYFSELGDTEAVAALDAFKIVSRVRNRVAHAAYHNFGRSVEDLSDGQLKFSHLWPRTSAVVQICFRHVQRVPTLQAAIEAELERENSYDPMDGYEAWRGKG